MTKTIQLARKLSEFNSQALIAWDADYSYSYVAILYDTMRLKIFSYFLILYGQEDMLFKKHKFEKQSVKKTLNNYEMIGPKLLLHVQNMLFNFL